MSRKRKFNSRVRFSGTRIYYCHNCNETLVKDIGMALVDWNKNDGYGEVLCPKCWEAYRAMRKLGESV